MAGYRATARRFLLPFRHALPSWTTVPTRVVHLPRGISSGNLKSSRTFGSFISLTKVVRNNSADSFIANLRGTDGGNYLKLSVWADGQLEVYNSRTQNAKDYAPARCETYAGSRIASIRPSKNPYAAMPTRRIAAAAPKAQKNECVAWAI